MNALKKRKGSTLRVLRGVYTVNEPIHLVSSVNLHLEKGASIRFGTSPKDYPLVLTSWEETMLYNYSPLIYGNNPESIAITGSKIINGEGGRDWAEWTLPTPTTNSVCQLKKYSTQGITIEDSPFWCVHLLKCKSAILRGLKYDAHNFNNDGIDAGYSSDILIEEVTFDNGDDNIALKAGRDHEGLAN